MEPLYLTVSAVQGAAEAVAVKIHEANPKSLFAYCIPRGGVPAGYAVNSSLITFGQPLLFVDTPERADIFIDDIIDSGQTYQRYMKSYPGKKFYALVSKSKSYSGAAGILLKDWVVFPWEGDSSGSIEDNVIRLLQYIGEDPARGGLAETPRRVIKAWQHWCSGYSKNPAEVLKVFEDGADKCDEMVIVKDIPVYSKCEHHMADIFGTATVAYVPNGRIVGLSKISRLIDVYARRLQVQERLTNQIADALNEHLRPVGVGVIIRARHMCMESRGICQQGHHTITSALRGVLKDKPEARAEFMSLAK